MSTSSPHIKVKSLNALKERLDNYGVLEFVANSNNLYSLIKQAEYLYAEDDWSLHKMVLFDRIISQVYFSPHVTEEGRATLIKSMCGLVMHRDGEWLRDYLDYIKLSHFQVQAFVLIMLDYERTPNYADSGATKESFRRFDRIIDEVTDIQVEDAILARMVKKCSLKGSV